MDKVIELIESKIEEAKNNVARINSCKPSQMADVQGYAWNAIAFRFEELLNEIKGKSC